jgi:hypothetical protein
VLEKTSNLSNIVNSLDLMSLEKYFGHFTKNNPRC